MNEKEIIKKFSDIIMEGDQALFNRFKRVAAAAIIIDNNARYITSTGDRALSLPCVAIPLEIYLLFKEALGGVTVVVDEGGTPKL